MRNAFFAIFSSTRNWRKFRGTGFIDPQQIDDDFSDPFRFRDEKDNRFHTAVEGDTWWGLAWRFFPSFPNKSLLWPLLCEFQPEPVVDPTIAIRPGQQIVIPSERLVRTQAFNRERRRFH